MHVQKLSTPTVPARSLPKQPAAAPEPEAWDKVTFDKNTNSYHFEKPGHHLEVSKSNPFKAGLGAAAVIGVPSAVGALEHALLGQVGAGALTAVLSPAAGAVIGGAMFGVQAYKKTNKNPFYTGLAALAGAGLGTVAWPLLKIPGALGWTAGAVAATAGIGIGVGVWSALNNNRIDKRAELAGYRPEA